MTSISSTTAYQSPLARLQSTLKSDISTGSIQSSDQSALAAALESIDDTLSSGRSSETSGSKPPSPDEMKEKIADLIQQQVDAGTLTADQADELAEVFDETFSKGQGAQGAGGPPPGPPPEDEESTDATTSSSSGSSIADLLKELQEALTESNQTAYSASGSSTSSNSTSYLFDLVA